MEDPKLLREIADLDAELTTLRADEAQRGSTLASLEGRAAELTARISEARTAIAEREQRLEQAHAELADALREEAFRQAQDAMDATAGTVADSIDRLLSALEAYEVARGAVTDARSQLPPSVQARLGAKDVPDPPMHDAVAEAWTRLVSAVGPNGDQELDDQLVEAAARSAMGHAIPALPAHLRELARRRRENYLSNLARSTRPHESGN